MAYLAALNQENQVIATVNNSFVLGNMLEIDSIMKNKEVNDKNLNKRCSEEAYAFEPVLGEFLLYLSRKWSGFGFMDKTDALNIMKKGIIKEIRFQVVDDGSDVDPTTSDDIYAEE